MIPALADPWSCSVGGVRVCFSFFIVRVCVCVCVGLSLSLSLFLWAFPYFLLSLIVNTLCVEFCSFVFRGLILGVWVLSGLIAFAEQDRRLVLLRLGLSSLGNLSTPPTNYTPQETIPHYIEYNYVRIVVSR